MIQKMNFVIDRKVKQIDRIKLSGNISRNESNYLRVF